jgi:hypothetical protein
MTDEWIPALVPRDKTGFQFVCYADACSGVPGAPHEQAFAASFEIKEDLGSHNAGDLTVWKLTGLTKRGNEGTPQTLVGGCSREQKHGLPPVWMGLQGPEQRLCVLLTQAPERSPHLWIGPELPPGTPFEIQIALHSGMAPGGVLWRWSDRSPWSSLTAASPWGAESVNWPNTWSLGHGQRGIADQPFGGQNLRATWHRERSAKQ